MKRRGFLKGLGLLPVAPVAITAAKLMPDTPKETEGSISEFDSHIGQYDVDEAKRLTDFILNRPNFDLKRALKYRQGEIARAVSNNNAVLAKMRKG